MNMNQRRNRGMTLIEAIVAMGLSVVIFALILDALWETGRNTDALILQQQMRQEAMMTGQGIERAIRFRVAAGEASAEKGGAAPTPPAGGEAATSVPKSVAGVLTTATTHETTAAVTETKVDPSKIPPSVKSLLTTESASHAPRKAGEGEKYSANGFTIFSLAGAPNAADLKCEIANSAKEGSVVEKRGNSNAERPLAPNDDKFYTSVSFRYASDWDGLNAKWSPEISNAPKVVEYTVRVWPRKPDVKSFEESKDQGGRTLNFQLVSAVTVP